MKRVFLFFMSSLGGLISAQDISPDVIATSGSAMKNSELQIEWTIGEILVQPIQNSALQITQGFHQPDFLISGTETLPEDIGVIRAFPNPVGDHLEIKVELNQLLPLQIQLFDSHGKLCWTSSSESISWFDSMPTSTLAGGQYFLHFLIGNQFSQTLKIQKLR